MISDFPPGEVPPGDDGGGNRIPTTWVALCARCAGFAPFSDLDYEGALSGWCQSCGTRTRELHWFRAWIDSAIGCVCRSQHPRVRGDIGGWWIPDDC